jgi:hypothetical protein
MEQKLSTSGTWTITQVGARIKQVAVDANEAPIEFDEDIGNIHGTTLYDPAGKYMDAEEDPKPVPVLRGILSARSKATTYTSKVLSKVLNPLWVQRANEANGVPPPSSSCLPFFDQAELDTAARDSGVHFSTFTEVVQYPPTAASDATADLLLPPVPELVPDVPENDEPKDAYERFAVVEQVHVDSSSEEEMEALVMPETQPEDKELDDAQPRSPSPPTPLIGSPTPSLDIEFVPQLKRKFDSLYQMEKAGYVYSHKCNFFLPQAVEGTACCGKSSIVSAYMSAAHPLIDPKLYMNDYQVLRQAHDGFFETKMIYTYKDLMYMREVLDRQMHFNKHLCEAKYPQSKYPLLTDRCSWSNIIYTLVFADMTDGPSDERRKHWKEWLVIQQKRADVMAPEIALILIDSSVKLCARRAVNRGNFDASFFNEEYVTLQNKYFTELGLAIRRPIINMATWDCITTNRIESGGKILMDGKMLMNEEGKGKQVDRDFTVKVRKVVRTLIHDGGYDCKPWIQQP